MSLIGVSTKELENDVKKLETLWLDEIERGRMGTPDLDERSVYVKHIIDSAQSAINRSGIRSETIWRKMIRPFARRGSANLLASNNIKVNLMRGNKAISATADRAMYKDLCQMHFKNALPAPLHCRVDGYAFPKSLDEIRDKDSRETLRACAKAQMATMDKLSKDVSLALRDASQELAALLEFVGSEFYERPYGTELAVPLLSIETAVNFNAGLVDPSDAKKSKPKSPEIARLRDSVQNLKQDIERVQKQRIEGSTAQVLDKEQEHKRILNFLFEEFGIEGEPNNENVLAALKSKLDLNIYEGDRPTQVLKKGGGGEVFRVTLHAENRDVCVKVINKYDENSEVLSGRDEARVYLRILREARCWKLASSGDKSDRKRIVPLVGIYTVPSDETFLPSLISELRDGNLKDHLQKTKPDLAERFRLCYEIVEALEHLHSQKFPIIHGDLKTMNVLVNTSGDLPHIELCDFGATSIKDHIHGATTQFKFSHDYVAPELLDGDYGTAPGDMYAFGCVLLEVLYSNLPKRSDSDLLLHRKTHADRRPSGVQDSHWNLMTRLWSKDPDSRLTASQTISELKRLQNP